MKTLSTALAVSGLLALGYWAFVAVSARVFEKRETRHFVEARRVETVPPPMQPGMQSEAPARVARPHPQTGSVIALLSIPRLGLSTLVVEGAAEPQLKLALGHIPGTFLPGEGDNVGVAGHRDTFFRPLRSIRRDDTIGVATHEREYHYNVVSTEIVDPENVGVLYPTGHEVLTLVTCYPFDFVGAAPKRFIVRADCMDCRP